MKPLYSLIFLFIILILSCCKKNSGSITTCTENYQGKITLTSQEKLIQPYGINDSLVFINEIDSSVVAYKCKFHVPNLFTLSENSPYDIGYTGCLGNYSGIEYYLVQFNDQQTPWLRIQLAPPNPYDTTNHNATMRLTLSIRGDSTLLFDGLFGISSDTIFNAHWPLSTVSAFYDTMIIAGITYKKVYLLECSSHVPAQWYDRITKVYYTISDGIIMFTTKKGKIWRISEKFILH